ncbi:MAG: ribosome small subunit-dependent GTPase A [Phycisphaerae bacterium]|nr:ribosome small subunit-dependent GTPase A [Phycisphaerae bacterium]
MSKKRGGKKVRVDFRQNRNDRARSDDWTRRFHAEDNRLADATSKESVRAKGALSRKRTVIESDADGAAAEEASWIRGVVTIVHGLICYVEDAEAKVWSCTVRRILRTRSIDTRSPVTVGDEVWFAATADSDQERTGVIERVAERRSLLSRRDRRARAHAIVANADQLLIVASVAQPGLKPHLIDRYIVAALAGNLAPLICFNKIDLRADDRIELEDLEELAVGDEPQRMPRPTIESVIGELRGLGYRCLETSAARGDGIDELREAMRGRTTVLSGQSGVGKSSLLNAVQPGLALRTAEVSVDNEKGKHTTTHARLIRLDAGGYVVDTPGVRAFELWDVATGDLEAHFPEIASRVAHCRYGDCLHIDESDCAVRAAAESGEISERRYWSYRKMLADAGETRR